MQINNAIVHALVMRQYPNGGAPDYEIYGASESAPDNALQIGASALWMSSHDRPFLLSVRDQVHALIATNNDIAPAKAALEERFEIETVVGNIARHSKWDDFGGATHLLVHDVLTPAVLRTPAYSFRLSPGTRIVTESVTNLVDAALCLDERFHDDVHNAVAVLQKAGLHARPFFPYRFENGECVCDGDVPTRYDVIVTHRFSPVVNEYPANKGFISKWRFGDIVVLAAGFVRLNPVDVLKAAPAKLDIIEKARDAGFTAFEHEESTFVVTGGGNTVSKVSVFGNDVMIVGDKAAALQAIIA